MLSSFGLTMVNIDKGKVTIRGINSKQLFKDIRKMQGDGKIINNMLAPVSFGIEFNEFFLLDVFYILQRLYDLSNSPPQRYKLNKILVSLKSKTWLAELDKQPIPKLDLSKLKDLTYTPLDFQLSFLEYYSSVLPRLMLNGTLLSASPGTGKTFTTLAVAHCLNSTKIVVICPLPAVIKVWESSIHEIFKDKQSYWLSTSKEAYAGQRIAVYHYEALGKAIEDISVLNSTNKITLILDESHYVNEIKSMRTQLFLTLVQKLNTKDILFASGTPVKALGNELITLFRAIDPLFNSDAEERFRKIYNSGSIQNAEVLKARLGMISFKVEKSAINLEAPNLIDVSVKIKDGKKYTLSNIKEVIKKFIIDQNIYYDSRKSEDEAYYDACLIRYERIFIKTTGSILELDTYKNNIRAIKIAYKQGDLRSVKVEIEQSNKFENSKIIPALPQEMRLRFKEVKTLVKYRSLKIQGECLGRILGRFRIDCHVDMIDGIDFSSILDNAEKKTVIFSSYVEVCERVVETLKKLDYAPVSVYGMHTKQLSNSVSSFEKNDEINPLVATYASLSTAVPLIVANTVVLINSPFRAYIQEQAISRVHRLGATTAIFVYQCTLDTGDEPNISTRGIDILKWSQEQVEAITGMENIFKDNTIIVEGDDLRIANESIDTNEIINLRRYKTDNIILPVIAKW